MIDTYDCPTCNLDDHYCARAAYTSSAQVFCRQCGGVDVLGEDPGTYLHRGCTCPKDDQ